MKKLFLLSALAMSAMTMSAQITQIGTFTGDISNLTYSNGLYYNSLGQSTKYVVFADSTSNINIQVSILSLDNCSVYKTLNISKNIGERFSIIGVASKDFWSNDQKLSFVMHKGDYKTGKSYVINEDGTTLCTFRNDEFLIIDGDDVYYIIDRVEKENIVYSIPKYTSTSLPSPTTPSRTSNVQKVIENGQMYIILDGVKYAVTGTEM